MTHDEETILVMCGRARLTIREALAVMTSPELSRYLDQLAAVGEALVDPPAGPLLAQPSVMDAIVATTQRADRIARAVGGTLLHVAAREDAHTIIQLLGNQSEDEA